MALYLITYEGESTPVEAIGMIEALNVWSDHMREEYPDGPDILEVEQTVLISDMPVVRKRAD